MFDVGASELLLVVIVAIVVIGPKDLPLAMRTAGRWIGKMRRISGYFRSGIETMIREAELEEMEKKWREQNEAIMKAHPAVSPALPDDSVGEDAAPDPASAEGAVARQRASAQSMTEAAEQQPSSDNALPEEAAGKERAESQLPLSPP